VRDATVTSDDLRLAAQAGLERSDALVYLGSPATSRDEGRGAARRVFDDYAADRGCWLNRISSLEYDATGVVAGAAQSCICGLCVDASQPIAAEEIEAVDVHWTTGPWVRLDRAIDVTADHHVLTERGWVRAGDLAPGDRMLDERGAVRVLESVERLETRAERLGRNVRTRSGTFRAGGFVFLSEEPTPCTPEAFVESPSP
jgi:hypothetical protein